MPDNAAALRQQLDDALARLRRLEEVQAAQLQEDEALRQRLSRIFAGMAKQLDLLQQAIARTDERTEANLERIQTIRQLLQSFELTLHVLINRKPGTDPIKEATRMIHEQQRRWSAKLAQMIVSYFNEEEARALTHDLGWNWEEFGGESYPARARSMTEYALRRGTLQLLAGMAQEYRPHVQWPLYSVDA